MQKDFRARKRKFSEERETIKKVALKDEIKLRKFPVEKGRKWTWKKEKETKQEN